MIQLKFKKRVLYLFAAVIWIIAGINILHIGIVSWHRSDLIAEVIWLAISLVFFSGFIFPKVVKRNIQAVRQTKRERLSLWCCMVPKAWAIMAVMMTFGIALRYSGLVPKSFIAGFYVGLGVSLIYAVRPYIKQR